jgi:hypothetical protein
MAKPRVFISSTFYDLKQVRSDLERFVKELGYESVLNERGNIPYGSTERLENYCYKEVELCDIIISIIGGRFGSKSEFSSNSITQTEIQTALKNNKQVYCFIEKNVWAEFQTYLINKDTKGIKYNYVDTIEIFQFIEHIRDLPNNNPIHAFETSSDIIFFLKEQWAGLFQRFLQQQSRINEINIIDGLEKTADTLNQLVSFLTEEKRDGNAAIIEILMSNHPAMETIRELLGIKYRVYFTNFDELNESLNARSFYAVQESAWDSTSHAEWVRDRDDEESILKVALSLFDESKKLRVMTHDEWDDSYITLEIKQINLPLDEEIPF